MDRRNEVMQNSTMHQLLYDKAHAVAYPCTQGCNFPLTYFDPSMGHHQLRKKCEFFRENINRKNDFNKKKLRIF